MKHIGKLVAYLILAGNIFFIGLLLLAAYSPYIKPTAHPVVSCLGLTFPIFLIINGCFLIFWLIIRRYKFALCSLIGFLLCCSQIHTYLPINFHTSKLPENSFKILSYNVMGFDGTSKKNGKNPILDYLKNSGADILCLQEYQTRESPRYLSQKDVEKALKDYPYHSIQIAGTGRGHTNRIACYSKFPILSTRKLNYKSDYNGSVAYELKLGEDTVLLINNHLESNKLTPKDKVVYESMLKSPETEKVKSGTHLLVRKLAEASSIRAPQADCIAREIKESRYPYIIVCGDFNDTPISYSHRVIGQNLNDAFTQSGQGLGISYNQNKFYFRIDHILASKNLKPYNCTVDRSIKEVDHYPIWCYLERIKN
ncbi:endonuclease/exonuclease/phosphatase family protein [Bacteroides sp. UBA939]|uniref:endonuclease/exonuclease/phosphatase family protein n=1 Tax=Bacteroides sp. UBA939 TaxID=1946092 RepID=UPI0025C55C61|nr:endonuclease/exonuclease/phosphatase family protein [Bacteroides sp. UBA939]